MTPSSRKRPLQGDFVWWKHGVIYQVYPRSFQDSDGDGIGDLQGLISRLDALAAFGIDAIWLSPIFASPMADFGYDVSDHTAIDPIFGDLASFRRLVAQAHQRGLKLILDYIPNHTSEQHRWFEESRGSRTNPRQDWYVWRDPGADGGPPNNWRSEFGGCAWTFEPRRGQYYYHAFLPSQPDLNWHCAGVVDAMLKVLDVWIERGVDGFRVDAIHHLFEASDLADNPPNPDWRSGMPPGEALLRVATVDQPQVHEAIAAMRQRVDDGSGERVLIGEAYLPIDRLMAYYGGALEGFHLPFNFHLMSTPWRARDIADLIVAYESQLPPGGWPNWVLGNHDRSRLASRVGAAQTRVAAMLLLTLRGTPTLYQGDELGICDVPIAPDQVRDPWERNVPGLGLGRDPVRTPMLWDDQPQAGFSSVAPWLPLSPDWRVRNLARQSAAPGSLWSLYRDLLQLRRRASALHAGAFDLILAASDLLVYARGQAGDRWWIALDLGGGGGHLETPAGQVMVSTDPARRRGVHAGGLTLAPNEGVILRLD